MSDQPPFGPDGVTSSGVRRAEDVCDHFEAAWKGAAATGPPRIETHLALVPEAERPAVLVELIALDMDYRQRAGERPCREDYQARFPSFQLASLPSTLTPAPAPSLPPSGRQTASVVDAGKPAGTPVTRIRCPNCHNPIDLADDRPDEVLCPGCGSSFRVREARQTTTEGGMRPLGKFQLLERVGLGAFGAVWRAKDTELDRVVALKIPHASLLQSEADLERFHREARAAAQLRHPGIVTVHEVQVLEGLPTLVSDFIDGVPLRDLLETRRLTFRESAVLLAEVAEAVDYAHGMGLVHRDIKPANIMMDYGPRKARGDKPVTDAPKAEASQIGRPMIMDFGLALREKAEVTLTLDGHIIGTPAYMSPEQAEGKGHEADRRSDVYSLGVILYELLTGELPFRGSKMMILHQVLREDPQPPRRLNDKIPRDLETICLKALNKEPAHRYPTARALAEELRRWLRGEPIKERPASAWERGWKWVKRRPAVAALLLVSGVAALALVGLTVGVWYNTKLQAEKERAEEASSRASLAQRAAEEASTQATLAQGVAEEARKAEAKQRQKAEDYRYANEIVLAEREWRDANVGRSKQRLEQCPGDLRGWEWRYLKRLCHLDLRTIDAYSGAIGAVAYSPAGDRIASTGEDDNLVKVWDATTTTRKELFSLPGPKRGVGFWGVAYSPNGRWIAAASGQHLHPGEVKVWDAATRQEHLSFKGHTGRYAQVAFSPDGQRLAAASGEWNKENGYIIVWDTQTGNELARLLHPGQAVLGLAFSPDGKEIASSTGIRDDLDPLKKPGAIKVWDWKSNKEVIAPLLGHNGAAVTSVVFSPDGKHLASGSTDGTVKIWDTARRREALELRGHTNEVFCVAFSPDGNLLASASLDQTVRVWNAATGVEGPTLRGHTGGVRSVVFHPDSRKLASGDTHGGIKTWDATTYREAITLDGHGHWATGVAFSPDGQWIASASIDQTVRLWEAERTSAPPHLLGQHTMPVWSVAFSPDSRFLASAAGNWTKPIPGEVKVWDVKTPERVHTFPTEKGIAWQVAFSPNGKWLAAACGEMYSPGEVKIWETKNWQQLPAFPQKYGFPSLAFSPDERHLAISGGNDNMVRILELDTGHVVDTLEGHKDAVFHVAYSPDGRRLASASEDQTVRVWDTSGASGGKATLLFPPLSGHTGATRAVAFSPDGARLASASLDRTVKVWDANTGQEYVTLRGHLHPVMGVAFSPDGRRLASASQDKTMMIWDGTPWQSGQDQAGTAFAR